MFSAQDAAAPSRLFGVTRGLCLVLFIEAEAFVSILRLLLYGRRICPPAKCPFQPIGRVSFLKICSSSWYLSETE